MITPTETGQFKLDILEAESKKWNLIVPSKLSVEIKL
jgi:hypothetical protein